MDIDNSRVDTDLSESQNQLLNEQLKNLDSNIWHSNISDVDNIVPEEKIPSNIRVFGLPMEKVFYILEIFNFIGSIVIPISMGVMVLLFKGL